MKKIKQENKYGLASLITGIIAVLCSLSFFISMFIQSLLWKYSKLWLFYFEHYKLDSLAYYGPMIGPLLGIFSIIFSSIQRKKIKTKSAKAGLILGITSIAISALFFIALFILSIWLILNL